jgi:hypothetical protein
VLDRRTPFPAAARGWSSPELLKSDAPGVKTTRARVRDGLRDMDNSPRAKAGLGEASGGAHDDEAVRHGSVLPARVLQP